jgi:hypothetical protein
MYCSIHDDQLSFITRTFFVVRRCGIELRPDKISIGWDHRHYILKFIIKRIFGLQPRLSKEDIRIHIGVAFYDSLSRENSLYRTKLKRGFPKAINSFESQK